uniref:Uncharacterized protein n=1 Tax=Piliocolobus tephrosceles TaxID=591936 RepID=A0A8C9HV82_9PRIM
IEVARAGVLGIWWLRRATQNMVSLGAWPSFRMIKDMPLGFYSKTPEEWATAAKKYNMCVEDYQPYLDDGMVYGNYSKFLDHSQ